MSKGFQDKLSDVLYFNFIIPTLNGSVQHLVTIGVGDGHTVRIDIIDRMSHPIASLRLLKAHIP